MKSMMKTKTLGAVDVSVPQLPRETAYIGEPEKNDKLFDRWAGFLMVIAGLVSGYLSYKGAAELFGSTQAESMFIGIAFAIVVEGAIIMALWALPHRSITQKSALMLLWAVAVSFSIFTALLAADGQNQGMLLREARNELTNFQATIAAALSTDEQEVEMLKQNAQSELDTGATSGKPGRGGTWREMDATAKVAEAEFVKKRETINRILGEVEQSKAALGDNPKLTDLQAIFDSLKPAAIVIGVPMPASSRLMNDANGAFERAERVWSVLTSADGTTTQNEKRRTFLMVFVASLMEALALLLGLIRVVHKTGNSHRAIHVRLEDTIEDVNKIIAVVRRALSPTSHKDDEPKAISNKARGLSNSATDQWREGIVIEARVNEETPLEVVHGLFRTPIFLMPEGIQAFPDKALDKHPAIKFILSNTSVITVDKNGWRPGAKWNNWKTFLVAEHHRLSLQLSNKPRTSRMAPCKMKIARGDEELRKAA